MMTMEIPAQLRDRFEKQAKELYGDQGEATALTQAVELWLSEAREDPLKLARALNNRVFDELKPELEATHRGEWVVIARGKVQGISPNFGDVKNLALDAGHRIVARVGEEPPRRTKRLGWRIQIQRKPSAGMPPTSSPSTPTF
ncbi:MAG: hypothetical protein HY023_17380 [Chloroflexi bacterium]|nr:hypothetical protein [Chloroflexota bacterium]MBI3761319.1 hypothetical protein [Chloroflexota bacterium]